MKKVLVCALAALMLMSTCMTALAETVVGDVTYVTTTTYVLDGETTKLKVDTDVTGAADNTMLTYLAYTTSEPTDETIVYIDQQTAVADTTTKFSYTTAESNITGVTVKYGSSSTDSATPENDVYNLRNITVSYNEATEAIALPTTYNSAVTTTRTLTTLKVTGSTALKSYTAKIGETDVKSLVAIDPAGSITITDGEALTDGATIVITAEFEHAVEAPTVDSSVVESGRFSGYESGEPVEKMTMFGYATGATGTNWGGIIVGTSIDDVSKATVAEPGNATVYPALYRNSEGAFAVQLVNKSGVNELTKGDWYGKIYVGAEDKAYNYSDVITIAVKAQAGY